MSVVALHGGEAGGDLARAGESAPPPEPDGANAATPEAVKSEPEAPPRPAFPPPAARPTQEGPRGIRFDFNLGARLILPKRADKGRWAVRLRDLDSGNILFESRNQGAFVASAKRFFVRFRLEVRDGEALVFEHDFDCADREVLIQFPVGTLGDILAWFPYAARFQKVHGCKLTCALSEKIIPLLAPAHPHIAFVTHQELVERKLSETFYATYSMGLFFDDADNIWQPTDFRHVGLHKTAAYILGVDPAETAPRISITDESRPIPDKYICIAVQSTSGAKAWNNPDGWRAVVEHAKARGRRVICIDQKPVHGSGLLHTHIPHGAQDETGDRPLLERARWLKHADAFVGLSSGLAWLAWACGTRVVLVSGFTHPTNEFHTPFRVVNWHACNSCWNDPKERFVHTDFMWCLRHQNTPRHFECTRLITGAHVIGHLERALAAGNRRTPDEIEESVK